MPSGSIDRLGLPVRFLLKGQQRAAVLDRLSPVLSAPTAAMLLDTFSEDPNNFSALHARLQRLQSATEPDAHERLKLADLPIVPVHGQPKAPSTLAFTGNQGDYWGDWKNRIPATGLSQEDQRRYRDAGVTSALPNTETSRAFFVWLSTQDQAVLRNHIPCVLRHILHPHGPAHWAKSFTDAPFIPAKGRNGLQLVSLQGAQRMAVYLPDAKDMGDAVIQQRPSCTDGYRPHVKEVMRADFRTAAQIGCQIAPRGPWRSRYMSVGAGDTMAAPVDDILAQFQCSFSLPRFRRTFLKRLDELGVESELVRHDWHDRLGPGQGHTLGG